MQSKKGCIQFSKPIDIENPGKKKERGGEHTFEGAGGEGGRHDEGGGVVGERWGEEGRGETSGAARGMPKIKRGSHACDRSMSETV